jgi:hypothetical protein
LRLWTHSTKPTYQFQTYLRCLTIFICCECANRCNLTMLLSLSLAKPFGCYCQPRVTLGNKPQHYAVVEELDSFIMKLTSIPNICKVFDNLHMLWMYIFLVHPYHVSASLISKGSQNLPKESWMLLDKN